MSRKRPSLVSGAGGRAEYRHGVAGVLRAGAARQPAGQAAAAGPHVRHHYRAAAGVAEPRLAAEGVMQCVMEATSASWKPLFYLLEDPSRTAPVYE
jgi:hypothetical protein